MNIAAVLEAGAIKKFGSIEEPCRWVRLPPDELAATHKAFQRAVKGELSDSFGRKYLGIRYGRRLWSSVTVPWPKLRRGLKVNYHLSHPSRWDPYPEPLCREWNSSGVFRI